MMKAGQEKISAIDVSYRVAANELWWHAPNNLFSKECFVTPEEAVEALQRNIRACPEELEKVDTEGMTLLHWSALLAKTSDKNRAMSDWLIDTVDLEHLNRRVRLRSNAMGPYDGETILHIFLVQRDLHGLARVLQRSGVNLEARAYGKFFRAGNGWGTYYGEYPLSFAVSADFREGLNLLAEYISNHGLNLQDLLRLEDSYGNTALHMSVLHKREWMHRWLRSNLPPPSDSTPHLNGLGLTSLSLAALCNDQQMFDHVLKDQYEVKWVYGPVTCFRLPMEQIDSISLTCGALSTATTGIKSQPQHTYRSVMELILHQRCGKIAAHPLIAELQDEKWRRFGRVIYMLGVLMYIAKLLVLTLLTERHVTAQEETSSNDDTAATLALLEIILFLDCLLQWGGFAMDVISGFVARHRKALMLRTERDELNRPSKWILEEDWKALLSRINRMTGDKAVEDVLMPVTAFDVIGWMGEVALTIHVMLYWAKDGGVDRSTAIALSLGTSLAWMAAAVLLLPWEYFGVLVIIIIRVFKHDVSTFLALLTFNIVAIAQALNVLVPSVGPELMQGAEGGFEGALTMYRVLLGEKPSWASTHASSNSMRDVGYLPVIYYILFTITSAIVLLRLLISMFNKTFAEVWGAAQEQWRLEFGLLILRFERRLQFVLPRSLLERLTAIDEKEEEGHSYVFILGGWAGAHPDNQGQEQSGSDGPALPEPRPPNGGTGLRLEVSRLLAENERLRKLLDEKSGQADFLS
mmetsp:Transcript_51658/g.122967  ORF Transcript_51658/g.122967 Transcript_51658/m.122967 type:complete len:750 (+) Transcript_51658:75-2324(+)